MENAIGKWSPAVLIVATLIASMASTPALPASVAIDFGRLLPIASGAPAETAPRWMVLYALPLLALGVWLLFRFFPTWVGERLGRAMFRGSPERVTSPAEFVRLGTTYNTIVLGVVMLVVGVHAGVLAAALGAYDIAARLIPTAFGVAIVMMGNVFPRLKPNWVAGIRTKRTLADADVWRRTHRTFGTAFVGAGLVTIAAAVIAPRFGLLIGICAVLVACIIGFIASRAPRAAALQR